MNGQQSTFVDVLRLLCEARRANNDEERGFFGPGYDEYKTDKGTITVAVVSEYAEQDSIEEEVREWVYLDRSAGEVSCWKAS